jgi:hypothetical protein
MSRHCHWLTALLILSLAGAAPAAEPAGEPPPAPAAETGDEAGQPPDEPRETEWVVVFTNGDRLHCQLRGLTDGKLAFSSRMAPGRVLYIETSKVQSLSTGKKPDAGTVPWADTLHLHNGSSFRGWFTGLTAESLEFRIADGEVTSFPRAALRLLTTPAGAPQVRLKDGTSYAGKLLRRGEKVLEFEARKVGVVKIPLDKVAALDAQPPLRTDPRAHPEKHVVVTGEGDVLIGELKQAEDGALVVSGGAVEASCRPDAVRSIRFPLRAGGPGDGVKAGAEPKGKPVGVLLGSGSTAVGTNPVIQDGRFSFTLPRGGRLSLPLSAVAKLTMSGDLLTMAPGENILVWGRYADRGEEFAHTVAALKKQLKNMPVVEDFSDKFDTAFERRLGQARALVIPEPEKWEASKSTALAAQLKPLADAFLRRGGNIVVCGADSGPCLFLRQAGLLDVSKVGSISGGTQNFGSSALGRAIADGVGTAVTGANSTYTYRIGGSISGCEYLTTTTNSCAIVGRKVGPGAVVLLGADFYHTNATLEKVLANAVNVK